MTQSQELPDLRLSDRDQIQYLLGNPPSWMMQYGISLFAGFFTLLLSLSYFISYPDVVDAKVTLVTANPPINLTAQTGGPIAELLVADQQEVEQGQLLAVIHNTANREHVLALENWLTTADPDASTLLPELQLGTLQNEYSSFCQHWKDFQYYGQNDGVRLKIEHLNKLIGQLKIINLNLFKQKSIQQDEFNLASKEILRQQRLHEEKVISDMDLEKAERTFLQQKKQLEATDAMVLQNQLQIRQLESQITEINQSKQDNVVAKSLTLDEDIRRLQHAILEWKQMFLVLAPISGKVAFSNIWSTNQPITAGQEMMAVVPNAYLNKNKPIGRAGLSSATATKIKAGMTGIIKLDGISVQHIGTIEAKVSQISLLPKEEQYLVELELPDTLVTSYGNRIDFRQGMSGTIKIIAEERRLIQRIFDRIFDLVQQQS